MIVTIAGGSGFLGRALQGAFEANGWTVRVLTRRPPTKPGYVQWQPDGGSGPWSAALADSDVVINLSGEGLADKRWSAARKQALRASRILPARSLAAALKNCPERSRLLITGSAVGYYGARGDDPVTEETPPGSDFLADLCVEWEREAAAAASHLTHVALVRTGIVLHPDGGALGTMLMPFRLGIGGPLGSGTQYWPWIHLDDWAGLVRWLSAGAGAARAAPISAWNATAPTPVTNREFSRTLGRVLHRPAVLPVPWFALRAVIGEFASFLTTGARVMPARALSEGFTFRFAELDAALRHLFA